VTRQNTEFSWPDWYAYGNLSVRSDTRAVFTPWLLDTSIEKTYELTVTASDDRTKKSTARIAVYFPADHTLYKGINNSGQVIGEAYDYNGSVRAFVKDGDNSTVIGNPIGAGDTRVYGINDYGHILGFYENGYFLKTEGGYRHLQDYQGTYITHYTGINNSGVLAGYFGDSSGRYSGFIKDGDDDFITFDHPLADSACDSGLQCGTFIEGISNSGEWFGYFSDSDGIYRGFARNGSVIVGHPDGGMIHTWVSGVNNSGQIAGYFLGSDGLTRGFLKDGYGFLPIEHDDTADEGNGAHVTGINDSGRIVGWLYESKKTRGFLRQIYCRAV
jgi:probable HAF family extracellular repeat protein